LLLLLSEALFNGLKSFLLVRGQAQFLMDLDVLGHQSGCFAIKEPACYKIRRACGHHNHTKKQQKLEPTVHRMWPRTVDGRAGGSAEKTSMPKASRDSDSRLESTPPEMPITNARPTAAPAKAGRGRAASDER